MEFFKIFEELTLILRDAEQDTLITMSNNVDQEQTEVPIVKAELPKDIDHLIEKAFQAKLHEVKAELPKDIEHVIDKVFKAKLHDLKQELYTTTLKKHIQVIEFKRNNLTITHILLIPYPMPRRIMMDHPSNQAPSNIYNDPTE